MKTKKKNHTRASLNLYLVAGLYLLYIDYSLLSKWSEVEPNKKIVVIISTIVFATFAVAIIAYSIKGLIAMQQTKGKAIEEPKKKI